MDEAKAVGAVIDKGTAIRSMSTTWKLEVPVQVSIGSDIKIRQIHLSLSENPTLHVGYNVGTTDKDGNMTNMKTHTTAILLSTLTDLCPNSGQTMVDTVSVLVDSAYAALNELGIIGAGSR